MSAQVQIFLIAAGCTGAVGLAGMGVIRLLRRASLRLSIQASGAVPVLAIVAGTLGTAYNDANTELEDWAWTANGATGVGSGDSAFIKVNNEGNYVLSGSGNAEAIATCFDQTPGGFNGAFSCFGNGSCSNFFEGNRDTFQCVLTGLGGSFISTDPIDPNNGAFVNFDSTTNFWSVVVDSGKAVTGTCFE